jgi:hypothetical protein
VSGASAVVSGASAVGRTSKKKVLGGKSKNASAVTYRSRAEELLHD